MILILHFVVVMLDLHCYYSNYSNNVCTNYMFDITIRLLVSDSGQQYYTATSKKLETLKYGINCLVNLIVFDFSTLFNLYSEVPLIRPPFELPKNGLNGELVLMAS